METGNEKDLNSHSTALVDETDLPKSGKKLEYLSSSSFDSSIAACDSAADNGVSEPKPIKPVEKIKIETNDFDDMIRLDSSSSSETEKHPTESSNSATFQEIYSPKMKPANANQPSLSIERDDEIDINTSSDEEDNPLDCFEVKSASTPSQSEVPYQNKVQVDVIDQSETRSSFEKKPEPDFSPRKTPVYSFSASSSSSDSDSSNEESFQTGSKETCKSLVADTNSPEPKAEKKLASNLSDDDIPISSMPSESQSPTQSPPMQMMERIEDPSSSPYRIPSHIFARNKSNTPAEWSAASNESLFSIHMGNTSFSRDQLCWLGKSGELCKPGEAIAPPSAELSSSQLPVFKPQEIGQKNADLAEEPVVTEATAAETMREVIRESAENRNQQDTVLAETVSRSANHSQRSDGSTKSFAFPIILHRSELLTGGVILWRCSLLKQHGSIPNNFTMRNSNHAAFLKISLKKDPSSKCSDVHTSMIGLPHSSVLTGRNSSEILPNEMRGEGEKCKSLKGGAEKQKPHFQSPPQSQPPSQPSSQPTTPKNSDAVPTSKSIKFGFNMRCFSCLSCCPFSLRK